VWSDWLHECGAVRGWQLLTKTLWSRLSHRGRCVGKSECKVPTARYSTSSDLHGALRACANRRERGRDWTHRHHSQNDADCCKRAELDHIEDNRLAVRCGNSTVRITATRCPMPPASKLLWATPPKTQGLSRGQAAWRLERSWASDCEIAWHGSLPVLWHPSSESPPAAHRLDNNIRRRHHRRARTCCPLTRVGSRVPLRALPLRDTACAVWRLRKHPSRPAFIGWLRRGALCRETAWRAASGV